MKKSFISRKTLKMLKEAFDFEEKTLFEFQYSCYEKIPDSLNEKEAEEIKMILDVIMLQTLNHANILSDLIINLYERTAKKL